MVPDSEANNITDDLDVLRESREQQELTAENGIIPPDAYKQLLIIYLIDNDVVNAKFLWKRIPDSIKAETPELQALWKIGQHLWKRDFVNVYVAIKSEEWSCVSLPLLEKLVLSLRKRLVKLVAQAYSNIHIEQLGNLLGLNEQEVIALAAAESWEVDEENKLIKPLKIKNKERTYSTKQLENFDQLMNSLTDYVTFLEN